MELEPRFLLSVFAFCLLRFFWFRVASVVILAGCMLAGLAVVFIKLFARFFIDGDGPGLPLFVLVLIALFGGRALYTEYAPKLRAINWRRTWNARQ